MRISFSHIARVVADVLGTPAAFFGPNSWGAWTTTSSVFSGMVITVLHLGHQFIGLVSS